MLTNSQKSHIILTYKRAETDRERKTAVIALAIEFDMQPKFIREVLVHYGYKNGNNAK